MYKNKFFKNDYEFFNIWKNRAIKYNNKKPIGYKYYYVYLNKLQNDEYELLFRYYISTKITLNEPEKEYVFFGFSTIKEKNNFENKFVNTYDEYYLKLTKNKYKYIHLSKKIDFYLNSNNDSYYNNYSFHFNPPGLWFSCGTSWIVWVIKSNYIYSRFKYNYLDETYISSRWNPRDAYSLNLDELKIKKIKNCKDLFSFSKKYKGNLKKQKTFFDIKKLKKDYDGIMLCPYIAFKCNNFLLNCNKDKLDNNNTTNFNCNLFDILENIALGRLTENEVNTLWTYSWETSTGVIFKNFNKIKYEKIFDN